MNRASGRVKLSMLRTNPGSRPGLACLVITNLVGAQQMGRQHADKHRGWFSELALLCAKQVRHSDRTTTIIPWRLPSSAALAISDKSTCPPCPMSGTQVRSTKNESTEITVLKYYGNSRTKPHTAQAARTAPKPYK